MSNEFAKVMPFKVPSELRSELAEAVDYLGVRETTLLRLCRTFGTGPFLRLVSRRPAAAPLSFRRRSFSPNPMIPLKVDFGPSSKIGPIDLSLPEPQFRKLELQAEACGLSVAEFLTRELRRFINGLEPFPPAR